MGDIVLERNLCFVDTPGSNLSPEDQTGAIIRYMYQQLLRSTSALNTSDTDFQNMLAGNGGSQVDAILYLISEGMSFLPFRTKIGPLLLTPVSYTCDGY